MKIYINQLQKKIIIAVIAYIPVVIVLKTVPIGSHLAYILYGILCAYLFVEDISFGLINFAFSIKKNKEAPLLLTRQNTLIKQKEYHLAKEELLQLRHKHPDSPELTMMLAKLYADKFKSPAEAINIILFYIQKRKNSYHKLNYPIAMFASELYQQLGQHQDAINILLYESENPGGYTPVECNNLKRRAAALQNILNHQQTDIS